MPTRKRREKRRDPLVACDQDVLRALMTERGLKIHRLAELSGQLPQTVAHLLKPGARCQRGRLKRIARALNVPPEMLMGGRYAIPVPLLFPEGYEYLYSARTKLAASRLLTEIDKAITRDFSAEDASPEVRALATFVPVQQQIRGIFLELIMISRWRQHFIRWNPLVSEERGHLEPAVVDPWGASIRSVHKQPDGFLRPVLTPLRHEKDPDHEAGILGIIRGLEHVLTPWFDGAAKLDYRAIRDFTYLPNHPFANQVERFEPTSPLSALHPDFIPFEPPPASAPDGGQDAT